MSYQKSLITILIVILVLPFLLYLSGAVFFVSEMENAVITRFGSVEYAVLTGFNPEKKDADEQIQKLKEKYSEDTIHVGAGLYFKYPFVEKVHYFDSRLLHWEELVGEVTMMDRRTLFIDTGGYFRIMDVIKFYKRLQEEQRATSRISSVISSKVQEVLSKTRLIEAVRNENQTLEEQVKEQLQEEQKSDETEDDSPTSAKVRYGRSELIRQIMHGDKDDPSDGVKNTLMNDFGIKLVDVMFTQLNYPQEVRSSVYDRMVRERQVVADEFRGKGERQRKEILGNLSEYRDTKLSEADERVKEILGKAEGKKIQLQAEAFGQDEEFYRFYRSLETYSESLGKNSIFLLSDDNHLLQYVTDDRMKSIPEAKDNSNPDDE